MAADIFYSWLPTQICSYKRALYSDNCICTFVAANIDFTVTGSAAANVHFTMTTAFVLCNDSCTFVAAIIDFSMTTQLL